MAEKVRLYCFPYGGAGASMYRAWGRSLPDWVEVVPVHLPGREHRIRDTPHTHVEPMVAEVMAGFSPDGPFALFGHSMGTLAAFEVARALRRRGGPEPGLLLVSGLGAPHVRRDRPRITDLPHEEFLDQLRRHFDVTEDLLSDPLILEMVLPVLRADLAVVENYVYTPEPPFDFPIRAFGGATDPEAPTPTIEAWKDQSRRPVPVTIFPAGHFYVNSHREELLAEVRASLEQAFRG